jgi:hypothetical protein
MLALLVFWRPLRRLMLVRHLRDPLFKVTSTARIENLWLLVEIALGDAGVIARPGEPAQSLVLRAAPTLEKLSSGHVVVHGLLDAAAVRDRVAYGLGLGPDDPARMEQVADDAYETVWSRLGDKGQLRALYRNLG